MTKKQATQKANHDRKAQIHKFLVGQGVMVRNLRPGPEWVPAVVVEQLGPVSYLVETADHQLWRRHQDHLKEFRDLPQLVHGGQEHHHSQQTEPDDLPSTGGSPGGDPLPVATGTTPLEGLEGTALSPSPTDSPSHTTPPSVSPMPSTPTPSAPVAEPPEECYPRRDHPPRSRQVRALGLYAKWGGVW